jgi:hypothetical protein
VKTVTGDCVALPSSSKPGAGRGLHPCAKTETYEAAFNSMVLMADRTHRYGGGKRSSIL